MDYAQEIIAIRTQNQLTQTAFAQQLQVCPASIRGWESGQYKPSTKRLESIDAMFGTNLAERAQAEAPKKRRYTRRSEKQAMPVFTDDVEVFKSVITLLKLFMLLNPDGRMKAIRKITAYANDSRYQIDRLKQNLENDAGVEPDDEDCE